MDRMRINKGLFSVSKFLMRPIYKIYEKMLWLQIKNGPFPVHIGIIPDGNRRWAKRSGFDPKQGHEYGYQRIKEVLKWIWELNIRYVTVYAMSSENCLYRPLDEREHLFNIVKKGLQELMNMPDIHEKKIQVKVFGRLELVPKDIVELAKKIEEQTKDYREYRLNIALCYGGRQEILDAVRKIVKDAQSGKINPESINEETFSRYLYTNGCPDPDLIIRTSGEVRISNFLLWQSAYSELYFCEAYWPEFRKIDFWRAIRSYQRRERRYGR
ncbi:Undecaprenyl pyrophosphate synthetase [Staphylothermus marinus F1]|uniref:Tritrans,polycis-undecaprenyl-diphosphate synthase (geranylgeranyl-diphosphate specific) n=1 Tax=Staphylothermus marinus (strain ATCC 43588 / DSM 3639 / JCM 9404 / F1) TaxID=399550 RepID=A3DNX7_STAMF|nr:polyprenyl diphosphate synthase [Staphylothermus marinus]ABN70337.1 Undecaprenyl pyrophosphate synthetase [Staphylothermus marinus F1]